MADIIDNNEQFLSLFIGIAEDILKDLQEKIIMLEVNPENHYSINSLFRGCHTLKGNAVFFGLTNIKELAHGLEAVFNVSMSGNLKLDKGLIEYIREGVRLLIKHVEAVKSNNVSLDLDTEVVAFLVKLKDAVSAQTVVPSVEDKTLESDGLQYFHKDTNVSVFVKVIKAYFNKDTGNKPTPQETENFVAALNNLSEVFAKNEDYDKVAMTKEIISSLEMIVDDSGVPNTVLLAPLRENFNSMLSGIRIIEAGKTYLVRTKELFDKENVSFRVEEKKIEDLSSSVSRLEEINKLFQKLRALIFESDLPDELRLRYQEAIRDLNDVSYEIFQILIKIKLVSPEAFLEKNKRIIIALAETIGKKVEVKTQCKNVLVERKNIEVLDKILIHILRNCIDHGIEFAQERAQKGKPDQGVISVTMLENKQELVVKVCDDGKGLDPRAIREAAFKCGKLTEEQKNNLGDQDSLRLIFLAGVSTRETVTDVSGRGIGMDSVLNTIRESGGTIEVTSDIGKGTCFELKFPIRIIY